MHTLTKLSGGALCAALLAGSSDIAARAQNALTTVSSQGMSESTAIRVSCGIGVPEFIDTVNQSAYSQNIELFTMPNMVGLIAGISVACMMIAMLPGPLREKCTKRIKTGLVVGFHLNTTCLFASLPLYGANIGILALILTMICISAFLSRRFWGEFLTCVRMPASNFTGFDQCRTESAVRRVAPRKVLVREAVVHTAIPSISTLTFESFATATEVSAEMEAATAPDLTPEQVEHFRALLNRQFQTNQTIMPAQPDSSDANNNKEESELLCLSR